MIIYSEIQLVDGQKRVDSYLVSKEIGHLSVKMTEKYANLQLRRLKEDFPSLSDKIQLRLDRSLANNSLYQLGSDYLQLS